MFCLPPLERNRCKNFVDSGLTRPGILTRFRRSRRAAPVSPGLRPVQLPRWEPRHGGVVRGTRRNRAGVLGRRRLPPELSLAPVSFERRPRKSFPQAVGGPPRGPVGNASGPGAPRRAPHSISPAFLVHFSRAAAGGGRERRSAGRRRGRTRSGPLEVRARGSETRPCSCQPERARRAPSCWP